MDLTRGNLTVAQFGGRFNELARFVPYLVANKENRVRKFERGLNPRIHNQVVCLEIHDFVELVYKASLAKESLKRNAMAMAESRKRIALSLNQNQAGWRRRPNGNNQEVRPRGNRSSSANGTPCPKCQRPHYGQCLIGTNRCYRCGQPDHIVRDCPKGGAAPFQTVDNHRLPT
jgi:hypothetical protein